MLKTSHLHLHPRFLFQSPQGDRQPFPEHLELNPSKLRTMPSSPLLLFLVPAVQKDMATCPLASLGQVAGISPRSFPALPSHFLKAVFLVDLPCLLLLYLFPPVHVHKHRPS